MKRSQWRQPLDVAESKAGSTPPHEVLTALSRGLDGSQGRDCDLSIERQRLAGRSNIYVVRAQAPIRGHVRWVIKQPHIEWSQDDVGSPLSAQEEFLALQRLHDHFKRLGVPVRVPTPIAYLPEIDALAMEFIAGPTIKDLLHYGSVLRPATLLDGLAAAGTFLRHLHALEVLPTVEVDLREEAEKVLAVAEEKLHPLGLALPYRVWRTLVDFPAVRVTSPEVWLHGDFGPANIILAKDGSTVGLDASLAAVGHPEDDLVRFAALVSGVIRLAPEIVAPPLAEVRRRLEYTVLQTYYQASTWPPLFELKYVHQLARRWCRLRELAQQHEKRGLVRTKFRVIGMQMRLLMEDSERRLVHSLGG